MIKRSEVVCPVCEQVSPAPNGVGDLLKNFALMDAMRGAEPHADDEAVRPRILCELCEDQHDATSQCLDCEEYLCDVMVKAHHRSKRSKDHKVESFVLQSEENNKSIITKWFCLFTCVVLTSIYFL